jgi:hypothetical protein
VPWKDLPTTAEQLRTLAGDSPDAYGKQIAGRRIGGGGGTDYEAQGPYQDYGMTGEVAIVAYE